VGELGFRVLEQHVKPNRDKIQQRVIRYHWGSTSVPRTTQLLFHYSMIAAPRGIARCGIARFGALMALTVLPRALYAAEIQCPAQIQVREQADLSGAHQWQSLTVIRAAYITFTR